MSIAMVKQKGLIQFEGSFSGINLYFRKGKAEARGEWLDWFIY